MKTIEINLGNTTEIIFTFIFFMLGLLLFILSVYFLYKDRKFKKKGVEVKFKVKDVKEDKNKEGIRTSYITTLEFEYNGETIEKTINTLKKFKIGSIKKGIFLDEKGNNNISVAGEGFYLAPGGAIILILISLVLMWTFIWRLFTLPTIAIVAPISVMFLYVFIYIAIYPKIVKKAKKSKTTKNEKIYYNDEEDKYSSVSKSLIRYIPKTNKNTIKEEMNKSIIIFSIIFILLGTMASIYGIKETIRIMNVKQSWQEVTAIVKDVNEYITKDSEGNNITGKKVTYNYNIGEKEYHFEENIGVTPKNYKKGEEVKAYYNPENSKEIVTKSSLISGVILLPLGITFIYIGVIESVKEKRKVRLYKKVIIHKGGEQ